MNTRKIDEKAKRLLESITGESRPRKIAERNMSYCRFENTAGDLSDCLMALQDPAGEMAELNQHEKEGVKRLVRICQEVVDLTDGYTDEGAKDFDLDKFLADNDAGDLPPEETADEEVQEYSKRNP